jgi:hypothetical protein
MQKTWLVIGVLAAGASALAAACGNDSVGVGAEDAGAESSVAADGGGVPVGDAGDLDAGEVVTDDDDAGADAGPCNAVANTAPSTVSTCISLIPKFSGGAIVPGTYWLTAVAALGSATFCQGTFIPVGFKETVDVTVTGGTATLESVFEIGGPPTHHRSATITPGAGDTSPATSQATCPTLGATGNVRYTSRLNAGGKQVILALLPYGAGAAIYRFEKQ